MLRGQKAICFKGGLEADLIDDHFINHITSLRIKELWLACDTNGTLPAFKRACEKPRKAGFNREKIKCYALSYGKDMDADEARCRQIYEAGAMPFMQLYRDFSDKKPSTAKNGMHFVASGSARRRLGPTWKGERISRSLTHEISFIFRTIRHIQERTQEAGP